MVCFCLCRPFSEKAALTDISCCDTLEVHDCVLEKRASTFYVSLLEFARRGSWYGLFGVCV
jgi:hypothetical protein